MPCYLSAFHEVCMNLDSKRVVTTVEQLRMAHTHLIMSSHPHASPKCTAQCTTSTARLHLFLSCMYGIQRFSVVADIYIRKKLRSGIPSLYSDLLPLYTNAGKVSQHDIPPMVEQAQAEHAYTIGVKSQWKPL